MENDKVPRENIDREGADSSDKESRAENEASLLRRLPPPPTITANDSLAKSQSPNDDNDKVDVPPRRQMDGGLRAWLIVLSSFMCNGLIFGVINSYSLVYVELEKILESHGVQEASWKAGECGRVIGSCRWIDMIFDD